MPAAGSVGVGVFGTGSFTNLLVPYLNRIGFRVVALWAPNADSARHAACELNVPIHTCNMDEVLLHQTVDLVLVLSPPALQALIVVKALGIGKHVLCERPLGVAQCDVARMLAAARYYPSLVSAVGGLSWRHLPTVRELRRVVHSPALGVINWVEARILCPPLVLLDASGDGKSVEYGWHCTRTAGGGALSTLGLPLIDLVQFISGQHTVRAIGSVRRTHSTDADADDISGNQRLPRHRKLTADSVCSCQLELIRLMDGEDQHPATTPPLLASVSVAAQLSPGSSVQLQLLVCGSRGHAQLLDDKVSVSIAGKDQIEVSSPPSVALNLANTTNTDQHTAISADQLVKQNCQTLKDSSLLPRYTQLGWFHLLAEMSIMSGSSSASGGTSREKLQLDDTHSRPIPSSGVSGQKAVGEEESEVVRGLQCPSDTAQLCEAQQLVAVLEAVRQSVQQRCWCEVALIPV